jgi:glycosyltransferase involved in cell wall biosynthesis
MRFTVLIPAHGHYEMIRFPIACVQRQTHADWELFIVCDGCHPETLRVVRTAAASDRRIRVYDCPKGERHGEAYRHIALQNATGEAVCYLSDDDLWFPEHLSTMAGLLAENDFAHTRFVRLSAVNTLFAGEEALSDPPVRARMLEPPAWNYFGPTCVGHTLKAYRGLPEGWAPAPRDTSTDLHMWRKWLRQPELKMFSSPEVTTLSIAQVSRPGMLPHDRDGELGQWFRIVQSPIHREILRERLQGPAAATLPAAELDAEARRRRSAAAG